jgi:hypothetical protein
MWTCKKYRLGWLLIKGVNNICRETLNFKKLTREKMSFKKLWLGWLPRERTFEGEKMNNQEK